ncbi:MAG: hypothetical protein GXX84_12715 [Acidobacteria bacterium]|nr:hypothetical protein [Acidobacteriota bacterium]
MSWPRLVKEIAEVCGKYPSSRKLLLVENYQAGQLLLQAVAKCAGGWLNLTALTPLDLAWSAVESEASAKGIKSADELSLECIVLNAYNKIQRSFFPDNPPLGLISAIAKTVSELRIAQIAPEELKRAKNINRAKARDLAGIMEELEAELSRASLLDEAGIYEMATGKSLPEGAFLMIPSSIKVTTLCREFLESYGENHIIIINDDPVHGATLPSACFASSTAEPETSLSYLYAPSESTLKPSPIELFSAVGMRNEIREMYRLIVERKISFDDIEVILPDYGAYSAALEDIAKEVGGISLTFGSGLPAFRSSPARCLAAFAEWISSDFPEPVLRNMFSNGNIRPPEGVTGRQTARILRSAQIGWGRERYRANLDSYCSTIKENLDNPEDDEHRSIIQERLMRAEKVRDHVCALLDELPGGSTPPEQYFAAAAAFLEEYGWVRSESEGGVLKSLVNTLRSGAIGAIHISSIRELSLRLQGIAGSVKTDASGATPGCIHGVPLSTGGLSGRSHVFVLGMRETVFPGTVANDPIMTDEERQQLSKDLQVSADVARQRAFAFGQALARVRGSLRLSYATQSLADGSRLFPSPLLLQAYRLGGVRSQVSGVNKEKAKAQIPAGYEELEAALGTPAAFIPEQTPLGSDEWWLSKIAQDGVLNDGQEAVLAVFPDLQAGRNARQQRKEDESGEFDGRLKRDTAFDPRKSRRVISATSLEGYAKCPRSYFFSHVLGISPPEELSFEPGQWLGWAERGSLLHDFYCRFLVELKEKKEKRDTAKHRKRAAQVLDQVIAEWKAQIPPPSESVFDAERSALHRSIGIFLEEESRISIHGRGTPEHFEISFGFKDSGMADPVEIKLPGGKSIFLRGRIDRIDKLAKPGTWAVWDYKTGSAYGFKPGQYTAGGTQLQHILYGCAAEQVLAKMGKKNPVVAVSGYLFTTERSDGNFCFVRDAGRRAEGLAVVNELLDAMAAGVFIGTGGNCGYCDWKPCCHPDEEQRWKMLVETSDRAANLIQKVQENE